MKVRASTTFIALILSVTVIQACSRPPAPEASCNFIQDQDLQRVSWKGKLPISLYIHSSVPADAYPAIDKAIAEYNRDLGRGREIFKVIARGVGGDLSPAKDGYSMIYWFKTWDPAKKTEQARTTIYWTGDTIFEGDVRINATPEDFSYSFSETTTSSDVDLASLLVHELGHVLGLQHNPAKGSVMNFSLDRGQDRRELSAVDLQSLSCEY